MSGLPRAREKARRTGVKAAESCLEWAPGTVRQMLQSHGIGYGVVMFLLLVSYEIEIGW